MGLITFLLGWFTCTLFLCGTVLWLRRDYGDRSRRILSIVWLVVGTLMMLRALMGFTGTPVIRLVLPANNLVGGLYSIALLYLYPMETIHPGWLNMRRGLLLFLLPLLLTVLRFLPCISFRELHTFGELWVHIGEFNVWFRLCILCCAIGPYALVLLFIPYNYMQSRVHLRWIINYTLTIGLISLLYALFMLTGSPVVSLIHLLVCLTTVVLLTYQELFVRFPVPAPQPEAPAVPPTPTPSGIAPATGLSPHPTPAPPLMPSGPAPQPATGPGMHALLERLHRLLDEEEVWRNPDLTVTQLAQRMGTNRSYLSQAIQEAGYVNYSDLMNRRRIQAFCAMAATGSVTSLQDAFFRVGFRSKETALRCFKRYTGTTPSDYLMKHGKGSSHAAAE